MDIEGKTRQERTQIARLHVNDFCTNFNPAFTAEDLVLDTAFRVVDIFD